MNPPPTDGNSMPSASQSGDKTPSEVAEVSVPLFFPISQRRLVILSLFSLGTYQIYWSYRNWELIKRRTRRDINPLARALLPVFYCDDLFEEVAHSARVRMMPVTIRPGWLTLAYIGLLFAGKLPHPFWTLSSLSFLPLLPVRTLMEEINLRVAPKTEPNDRFTGDNLWLIIIGGVLTIWALIGPFVLSWMDE